MYTGLDLVTVAVDYTDCLALTLPYNIHHFNKVVVVTTERCQREVRKVCEPLCAIVHVTDVFYKGGARFNKYAAVEEGLDLIGRDGWLCVGDCDVLWPKYVEVGEGGQDSLDVGVRDEGGCKSMRLRPGQLCTPLRHMYPSVPSLPPEERTWSEYPVHRNVGEWAGYCHIFHAGDKVLGQRPWYETNWTHAGGADTFFQAKWNEADKVRPPFEVLHVGPAGVNWMGKGNEADLRRAMLVRRGKPRNRQYDHEKIG